MVTMDGENWNCDVDVQIVVINVVECTTIC